MPDDATTGAPPEPRCTWCSAVLPPDHGPTCPSCGATLIGEGEAAVPGLTAIDADAILRNARGGEQAEVARPPARLDQRRLRRRVRRRSPPPGSLAPPPVEVRREMLRLELEAQVANAQAEVEAMAADAAIESGTPLKSVEEMVEAATWPTGMDPDRGRRAGPDGSRPGRSRPRCRCGGRRGRR